MLCKLWLANLMLGAWQLPVLREQTVYLCLKSTHFICVAPIYTNHTLCAAMVMACMGALVLMP